MCVIIDTNMAGVVFGPFPIPDAIPVMTWITDGDGKLAYGGKLAAELLQIKKFRGWLVEQYRAGNAIRYPDEAINREVIRVRPQCQSDDSHIIALARVSGARVLYTNDRQLQNDFTDKNLLRNPRGKVYQRSEHQRLFKSAPRCRAIPKTA